MAVGGALEPALVVDAYAHGVFPFYDAGGPVLWWCPDPRGVVFLDRLHVPRRLRRTLRRERFRIRIDTAFEDVMRACDENRPDGSWIHPEMIRCYADLHAQGHAHSLEVWRDLELVGGVYGVAVGGLFAAESMFHRQRDMSKVALTRLVEHLRTRGFALLDVQFLTPHLDQFGAMEIPRSEYLAHVRETRASDVSFV